MIIRGPEQMPRATALKRFPIPRKLGVSPASRILKGRQWQAPAGATRVKTFAFSASAGRWSWTLSSGYRTRWTRP